MGQKRCGCSHPNSILRVLSHVLTVLRRQCNREIPCNHCSRRRCIESCVYYANPSSSSATSPGASSASSSSTTAPSITFGIQKEPPRRFEGYSARFALKTGEYKYTSNQRRRSGSWGGRDLLRNEWSRWGGTAGAGAGAGTGSYYPGCSSGSARPRFWTNTTETWSGRALAESFGYFEGSKSNTLALIQKASGAPCLGPKRIHNCRDVS